MAKILAWQGLNTVICGNTMYIYHMIIQMHLYYSGYITARLTRDYSDRSLYVSEFLRGIVLDQSTHHGGLTNLWWSNNSHDNRRRF